MVVEVYCGSAMIDVVVVISVEIDGGVLDVEADGVYVVVDVDMDLVVGYGAFWGECFS